MFLDPRRRLAARFAIAGALFVAAAVAGGAWSIYTFARLSSAVDRTLRESQPIIDLSAQLAGLLEREDDAFLLLIAERSPEARAALADRRPRFDDGYARLLARAGDPEERSRAEALGARVREYRAAVDRALAIGDPQAALLAYHQRVNPILRRAVDDSAAIREHNFRLMERAGIRARDEARRATRLVGGVLAGALLMSILVALWLARSVVRPVTAITRSVHVLRRGDFEERVALARADELGVLADGFNRMAEALSEFRRSNLGQVLGAKATLEATLEALPDAVVVLGPEGVVDSMNERARRIFAGKSVDALPRSLGHLDLPASTQAAIAAAVAGAGQNLGPDLFALSFARTIEGARRQFLPLVAPIAAREGAPPGAILVLHDVTEFARLDQLRADVVAVASHELRSPLTIIRMNLLLLREEMRALAPREKEILATAVQGCDELSGMIERLLDMARIEAGALRLTRERMDLRPLVAELTERFRARGGDRAVALAVDLADTPLQAEVDAVRIASVLSNLIGNALKYSPPGGTIAVGARAAGDALEIDVVDQGPGVPERLRERVFDKFFRVEQQEPERDVGVKGAGLGLYLSRQIVGAHGGAISLGPGPGERGTRVVVRLPRAADRSK